ncbi:hypothetical protein EMIHUDRAFT_75189 [Emiliania huxleyi CCMP1516]|uniref:Glycosyl hydrolases family 39 N-terminal catalytic domain-containing protein n=2 Tax=Emiliania huxleyi TaxID=2903 RepID=A0A0D3JB13_EMIH1|nr:hypothetical protein EMIHUDRAFT_75189 [Emiliania huxleyi CCMP1516]EOD20698.1 hypothetical protein EMIHUDRAFT_75189 [Emiliania huxleyi CCMP1516]|eukprot:XP_005773127.1 hypothetical protein EMIHUDRAFT_75189 [Emiliania huxleyi CCMP1516]
MLVLAALLAVSPNTKASVDLLAAAEPFAKNWQRCVGSGHMLLGTRADWQSQLALAVNELGFGAIRGHGLLDDDMGVLPAKGRLEFYNVFDAVHALRLRPVVELSFTPAALVACGKAGEQPGAYKGLAMPPDSFAEWEGLVASVAEHLVGRYGLDAVSEWHFEVWNELWGVPFPEPYMRLYNASARGLKSVSPRLRVGGPATMALEEVEPFVAACRASSTPVDFVSSHLLAGCSAHKVLSASDAVHKAGLPFFLTEYNNGLGDSSRDDASAAAFVVRNVGLLASVDLVSWWSFSDIFEEAWMASAPFHNGYGLMTVHGIRKPAWRAFEMLASLGDYRLPVSGNVSPADGSSTSQGHVVLLLSNFHRNRSACTAQNVSLAVIHRSDATLPPTARAFRVDEAHANPLAEWHRQGQPIYPDSSQLSKLHDASRVRLAEAVPLHRLSPTQSVMHFTMPPFSVLKLEL